MQPKKVIIQPQVKKDNGQFLIDMDKVHVLDFMPTDKAVISIPAGIIAGNHKHARQEAFIALSDDLVLAWLDEEGTLHKEKMKDGDVMYLFILPPWLPHAVENTSTENAAIMLEFAEPRSPVEPMTVLA